MANNVPEPPTPPTNAELADRMDAAGKYLGPVKYREGRNEREVDLRLAAARLREQEPALRAIVQTLEQGYNAHERCDEREAMREAIDQLNAMLTPR